MIKRVFVDSDVILDVAFATEWIEIRVYRFWRQSAILFRTQEPV